jgi:DNA repair protein RadC
MSPTYILNTHDFVLTEDSLPQGKNYILKIKDMPTEDKPREKLLKYGASSLSLAELIAVIFNTGSKKEDVMSMASRVMKEYGEKSLMSQMSADKLAKDLDIPLVKALQLVACSEIGQRFYKKNSTGPAVIRTGKDVYTYLREMENLPKEHLRGIYLNSHYRVIHDEVISIGTINANLIHPREVFKPAIEYNAVALILAHNHPSGVTKPSQADIDITRQLISVGKIMGISLIDHIIIGKGKFASIDVEYT